MLLGGLAALAAAAAGLARADQVQAEFSNTLLSDAYDHQSIFCSVLSAQLEAPVYCDSLIFKPQTVLLIAAIQFSTNGTTVNLYANNNLTAEINLALHNAGFFSEAVSALTLITNINHNLGYLLGWTAAAGSFCALSGQSPPDPKN